MEHLCLNCESANMERTTKNVTVHKAGLSKTVPAVLGWHCPNCGEVQFLDDDGAARVWAAMEELGAQAKAKQAVFIRATRKKLRLTQKEAAEIFGGGANAFSEYERQKTQPPRSTIKLLQLLNRHPELLNEIRTA